ncbi:hypothetical protein [Thiorhodococcus minor]|uniref:Exo-alpha-sialidase n=1 Tax=Thiorhodococcus minor TaxID=57489 RepID=A0A6M0K0P1_9GAMM|nr:hypothetical protein [Thiorhodococcus minor]NEV63346.1 hypothetical protein [Thiorhodococcus minor]
MTRSGVSLTLLGLALLAGCAYGAPNEDAAVDLRFGPVLSPPWLFETRGGDLVAQSSRPDTPPHLLQPAKDGRIRDISAAASRASSIVAWLTASGEGRKLQLLEVPAQGELPAPVEIASRISSNAVRVVADERGRRYVLDASLGPNPRVQVTSLGDESSPSVGKRIELDIAEIGSIALLSAVVTEQRLYLFVTSSTDTQAVISALTYRLPSLERDGPVKLVSEADRFVFIEPLVHSKKPGVVYKYQRDGTLGLGIALHHGREWQDFAIPDAKGLDVARATASAWDDGRILIVLSGEDSDHFKQRIYAAASNDWGKTWEFQQISRPKVSATRAWLPDLAVSGDRVAVAWEDSRDIRAAVHLQLSRDRGRSWLDQDIQVSDERHYAMRPRIRARKDDLFIAWYAYRTDARKKADGTLVRLSWQDAFGRAQRERHQDSTDDKRLELRKTVNDYWDALQAGDLRRAYDHHDPFFRARMPFDAFAARRGQFVYHAHEIRSLEIDGNVARVHSTVNFEIPKLIVMGREQSVPRRDSPIEDVWLYVDRAWHRQYVDAISGGSAIKY